MNELYTIDDVCLFNSYPIRNCTMTIANNNSNSISDYGTTTTTHDIDSIKNDIERLIKENKDLRKCLAYLNTRVNELIVEKQMKEDE